MLSFSLLPRRCDQFRFDAWATSAPLPRPAQVFSHKISQLVIGFFPITGANEDRFYAGVVTAFDIALLVTHEKRTVKIDIVLSSGLKNHFRRRLATFAAVSRQMGTVVGCVNDVVADLA